MSRCSCRSHPVWLAIDALAWLVLDRSVLTRRCCPTHGRAVERSEEGRDDR